ncbi:MAG: septal ring lytic transglycosylase RlpA family protein [Hyphomicrobiales bacterium]|nr:septal ring lytic transglycosylase RlpA family protein [Hyphomicrobiales bacterium]
MVLETMRRRLGFASSVLVVAVSGALLAACNTTGPTASTHKQSKEYFAEAEYGVAASPRVTTKRSRLPRREGRSQVGKPYMVRGKWYYPKENPRYKAVGAASWYGDAFHGRLTANGEVYDMDRLTAAHPTMPLPSYARVTNLKDGASVVVRINDRGPYADGRIIDLSKRAAEMLDYSTAGVARVKVQYIGPAPLAPNDDQYLMASYRPGKDAAPLPGDSSNVMVAMNGPTPGSGHTSVPFPGKLNGMPAPAANIPLPRRQPQQVQLAFASIIEAGDPILPEFGPIVPERPAVGLASSGADEALPVLGYADMRVSRAASAFDALVGNDKTMTPSDIVASWKRSQAAGTGRGDEADYIAVGTFADPADSAREAKVLSAYGRVQVERAATGAQTFYSVSLYPDGRSSIDEMLRQAWAHGADDAMTVRD